ncbi:hypothetical protein KCP69_17025 [Salmonella enterica subsp. enterica]|nr:hypothetical protein KCP69_17025 [Salmonella enterica subsp. enterica]
MTRETQQPITRAPVLICQTMNPRAARAGQAYSRHLYSANRLKYPLMRKRLMKMWREAKNCIAIR